MPFLIPDVRTALAVADIVAACELVLIAWVRYHHFRLSFPRSILQVMGGALVFLTGNLIGRS